MPIETTAELADAIKNRRTSLGLRQQDLALAANVGVRFIVDVENGKETSQIGLVLRLLKTLGIRIVLVTGPTPRPSAQLDEADTFDPDNFSPFP